MSVTGRVICLVLSDVECGRYTQYYCVLHWDRIFPWFHLGSHFGEHADFVLFDCCAEIGRAHV